MPAGTARVVINVENPAKIAYFGHSGGMMIPHEPMLKNVKLLSKQIFEFLAYFRDHGLKWNHHTPE